ncbi:hypothetical protein J6590_014690 [Homalodisca vitripennis]|nr:hypothetical protein J6590_014690 [Homalodisca vitripennis]
MIRLSVRDLKISTLCGLREKLPVDEESPEPPRTRVWQAPESVVSLCHRVFLLDWSDLRSSNAVHLILPLGSCIATRQGIQPELSPRLGAYYYYYYCWGVTNLSRFFALSMSLFHATLSSTRSTDPPHRVTSSTT